MKYCFCFFAALTVSTTAVFADASGKTALEVLGKHVGGDSLSRVVQVVGIRGQHQPKEWRVVLSDSAKTGVFHLYTIKEEKVVNHEFVRKDYRDQLPGAAIPYKEVRIDSGEVFVIADREAKEAKIGFDALNYELRCPELSVNPVWYVDLRDQRNSMVGRLFVSAKNGTVLRKVWFPRGETPDDKSKSKAGDGNQETAAQGEGEGTPTADASAPPLHILRRGMAKLPNPLRSGQ